MEVEVWVEDVVGLASVALIKEVICCVGRELIDELCEVGKGLVCVVEEIAELKVVENDVGCSGVIDGILSTKEHTIQKSK